MKVFVKHILSTSRNFLDWNFLVTMLWWTSAWDQATCSSWKAIIVFLCWVWSCSEWLGIKWNNKRKPFSLYGQLFEAGTGNYIVDAQVHSYGLSIPPSSISISICLLCLCVHSNIVIYHSDFLCLSVFLSVISFPPCRRIAASDEREARWGLENKWNKWLASVKRGCVQWITFICQLNQLT